MTDNIQKDSDTFQMSEKEVYHIAQNVFWPQSGKKRIVKSWKKKEFLENLFNLGFNPKGNYFEFVPYYNIIRKLKAPHYWDDKKKCPTNSFFQFLHEVREALNKYFETDEARKSHFCRLEILVDRFGKGLELTTSKLVKGTDYETTKYHLIEIFNIDGSVNHTIHFGMKMNEGILNNKDFGLIMWERGHNISVLPIKEPIIILDKYVSNINKGIDLKYVPNFVNKPHEYRWEIKYNPHLVKGDVIQYTMKHIFERPFPMTYEDIEEYPDYHKKLKFAWDGVTSRYYTPCIKMEIHFPIIYKIWDYGVFIDEEWTGIENEQEKERVLLEDGYSEKIAGSYRILSLKVKNPSAKFTYSIKWKPPRRKDFPT